MPVLVLGGGDLTKRWVVGVLGTGRWGKLGCGGGGFWEDGGGLGVWVGSQARGLRIVTFAHFLNFLWPSSFLPPFSVWVFPLNHQTALLLHHKQKLHLHCDLAFQV